jgi:hypothetical protein
VRKTLVIVRFVDQDLADRGQRSDVHGVGVRIVSQWMSQPARTPLTSINVSAVL